MKLKDIIKQAIDIESFGGIKRSDFEFYSEGFFKHKRIRFVKDATLTIKTKSVGVGKYSIKKNFTSDGGSIPWGFGWLISRWAPMVLLMCYLAHDINFALQLYTFEASNILFYSMLKFIQDKLNIEDWRINAVIRAVNSTIGRHAYNDTDRYDKANKRLVSCEWSAK